MKQKWAWIGLGAAALAFGLSKYLRRNKKEHNPRAYKNKESVGDEYDKWTDDGVLERFWGEHIHHGYFGKNGDDKISSIEAKIVLIKKLMAFAAMSDEMKKKSSQANSSSAIRVLDIGCGIGGSSRFIAKDLARFGCKTVGISLSAKQVERAREITENSGLTEQCKFQVADALALPFESNSFDFVWTLESGEHMPNKKKFISEAHRVLKPGGKIIMATWCHRNQKDGDLTCSEKQSLKTIYDEWALPHFISIDDYGKIFEDLGMEYKLDDWSKAVLRTWPMAVWDGACGLPWLLARGPVVFYRTLRDVFAIYHMDRGFRKGYVRYGLAVATKREAAPQNE